MSSARSNAHVWSCMMNFMDWSPGRDIVVERSILMIPVMELTYKECYFLMKYPTFWVSKGLSIDSMASDWTLTRIKAIIIAIKKENNQQ